MNKPIKAGFIGVNPDTSWAKYAHLPALQSLPFYEISAVCSRDMVKAEAVRDEFDIPLAFDDYRELVASPEVDLVVITTSAPTHYDLVKAAIGAKKDVFCEWPLGRNLAETEELTECAQSAGVRTLIGLQGRNSRLARTLRRVIKGGEIGEVYSTSAVLTEKTWGKTIAPHLAYTLKAESGANIVDVLSAHSLDVICSVLGEFDTLHSALGTRIKTVEVEGSGQSLPATAPDHAAICGTLENGAIASYFIRPNRPYPHTVRWEIGGSEGEILVKTDNSLLFHQDIPIMLRRSGEDSFREVLLDPDLDVMDAQGLNTEATNIARLYAQYWLDQRNGTNLAPDFGSALIRHRLIHRIYDAAKTG